jgi:TPR repeat protein
MTLKKYRKYDILKDMKTAKTLALLFTLVLLPLVAAAEGPVNIDSLAEQAENGDPSAFRQLLEAGEKGDKTAQLRLGRIYERGQWIGMPPDSSWKGPNLRLAMVWYERAATVGKSAAGMLEMARMYEQHKIEGHDASEAKQWIMKAQAAADKGKPEAEFELGWRYELGLAPLKQDSAAAFKWIKKSADHLYPPAETALGEICMNGWLGEKQDYAQAMRLFDQASGKGSAQAEYDIGTLYANGWGVAQDTAAADKWRQKALEDGFEMKYVTVPGGTVEVPQEGGKP